MIITRELIESSTCPEALQWADEHAYIYGLTRKEFSKLIRQKEIAGETPNNWWADWVDQNYKKGPALAHGKKLKRLGIYKAIIPNITPQEFDNIEDALAVLEVAKNNVLKTEEDLYHVQARRRAGPNGYQIIQTCDITKDTCDITVVDEYFATFNLFTGQYEDFPTYIQAKNRMIELRNNRTAEHANSFVVEEKIQEIGDPDANYADFVPVQTVHGRKTHFHDHLDKIEKRPDPKPKKPKP